MKTVCVTLFAWCMSFLHRVDAFSAMPAVVGRIMAPRTGCLSRGKLSLFMVEEETTKASTGKVSADGNYYDDEVEPTKVTTGISNAMKERLAREASTGLDPNTKQTNVLLYIIGAVAVLVLVGGQGIFF